MNKLICLLFVLAQINNASANPMHAIAGANLKETLGLNIFGSQDLNLGNSNKDNGVGVPSKRNELGVETNIALHKTENSKIYFIATTNQVDLGRDFLIGTKQVKVKRTLTDSSAGFGYAQKNSDSTRYSFSGTYGSASDEFLSNSRDSNIEATGSYAFAPKEQGQFILLVHYSNNRTFLNNIPIPLFAYIHRYSKGFIITAGVPFVVLTWFDIQNYSINAILTPGSYGIDGAKYIAENLQVFSNFNFKARSFKHSQRMDDKTRLMLTDKKLMLGLKSTHIKNMTVSLAGAFSFDRFLYEGESVSKVRGHKLRQENDFILQSKIALNF